MPKVISNILAARFFILALVASAGVITCSLVASCHRAVSADLNSPPSGQTFCWQKGQTLYRDRNHDGKIDLEISGQNEGGDGSDTYKVDTNYDGFFDVTYVYGFGITGKPTYNAIKNIHEPVPVIGKEFVPVVKPPWLQ